MDVATHQNRLKVAQILFRQSLRGHLPSTPHTPESRGLLTMTAIATIITVFAVTVWFIYRMKDEN